MEHRVGSDGQVQFAGRRVAVGEERSRGEYHPIGVERSGRRLEFHDGAPVGHRADECVDNGPPCRGAGRALGADVRPWVEVPGPRPLVDPVQAIWRRQMRELGSQANRVVSGAAEVESCVCCGQFVDLAGRSDPEVAHLGQDPLPGGGLEASEVVECPVAQPGP